MQLDERMKELIAVGASVTANCRLCLEYHASRARASGSDDRDLAAAIAIAVAVREGAASRMDDFVAGLRETAGAATGGADRGCGCGV